MDLHGIALTFALLLVVALVAVLVLGAKRNAQAGDDDSGEQK